MNGFLAVYKRELKGYFATPVAYVYLVIFLFVAGWWTFKDGFYEFRQADMAIFFRNLPLFVAFMAPAAAMRLWAEERKSGSIELLFTLPITVPQAVIGKFLAAWTFLAIALHYVSGCLDGRVPGRSGRGTDYRRLCRQPADCGDVSGDRVVLLGRVEEPGRSA